MNAQSGEFAGHLALVTGAASGIGAAVARMLATRGAGLALIDRDADGLRALAATLPVDATCLTVDVVDAAAVERAVDAIEADRGPLDHLAHVAGILRIGDALEMAPDDWDACMAVNARAVFGTTRAVARRMRERRRGSIVVVGSNAATTPRAGMAAYAASKAAASAYLRCLALELAPHGVRCNLVSPGSTDTPMQQAFAGSAQARQAILDGVPERYRLGIPLGRIAEAADVAEAVCFLLGERARHIVMHDLRVDGGATLDA